MRETENFIFFYGTSEIYSNWHPVTFKMNGHTFYNSEQAMMYEKAKLMNDVASMMKILHTPNPKDVKKLGREIKPWDQKRWDSYKMDIMINVCLNKFESNDLLKNQLIKTENKILVEASPDDKIWGIGLSENDPLVENEKNWKGENLLGKALMSVREIILAKEKNHSPKTLRI